MTDPKALARRGTTSSVRDLSNELFGRDHQLEVAAAAAGLGSTFGFEEAYSESKTRAEQGRLEPPGRSAVRDNLRRLAAAGALRQISGTRPGEKHTWIRVEESAYWSWLEQVWPGG